MSLSIKCNTSICKVTNKTTRIYELFRITTNSDIVSMIVQKACAQYTNNHKVGFSHFMYRHPTPCSSYCVTDPRIIYVQISTRVKCCDEDTFDELLGRRICRNKHRIKINKFKRCIARACLQWSNELMSIESQMLDCSLRTQGNLIQQRNDYIKVL